MAEPGVSPTVARLAAYAWRLLVIAAAGVAVLWLLGQLRVVLFPVVIALLLARLLVPMAQQLRRRRVPPGLAAAVTLLGFLAAIVGVVALIAPAIADEFDSLGGTVSEAVDDLERWLVEDSGLDISGDDVEAARERLGERVRSIAEDSSGRIAEAGVVVAEGIAGLVIAMFLTFFILKDGPRLQRWTLSFVRPAQQERVRTLAARSWHVLGGYLRGAALLGVVEGVVIAIAITIVGGSLAIPVAVVTFLAAFVPFVGAIVAGLIAVLVTLATAGFAEALIIAIVAIVVQQLDNDFLAPVIYGNALSMHPAAIILAVAAGGALFGLPGTFLAVPVAAVASAIGSELRTPHAVADP